MNNPGINRRKIVKLMALGAGATSLGIVGISSTGQVNYSDPAYLYWKKNAPGALEKEHYLVLCAALAASAHNTQPWRFQINENTVDVYADFDRNLGAADRDRRLMALSVGCAIENISVAGKHLGLRPEINIQPEDVFLRNGFSARVKLHPEKTSVSSDSQNFTSGEFNALFTRQTTRAPYLDEPVSPTLISTLMKANDFDDVQLHFFNYASARAIINNVHEQAVQAFVHDEKAYDDSLHWWRYTREELVEKRDGISIYTSAAPNFIKQYFTHAVTPADMRGEMGRNGEADLMRALFSATPLWAAITTSTPGLTSRLNGGRLLERLYLRCAQEDYRMMPIAYVTEQAAYAQQLMEKLKLDQPRELLSMVRIGKADLLERAVRRPLSDIIVEKSMIASLAE